MRRRRKKRRVVGGFTRHPRRGVVKRRYAERTFMLALVAVIVLCLVMIASILLRTARTKRLNNELAALHAAEMSATVVPEPTAEPLPTDAPTETAAPTASPAPAATATPAAVVSSTLYHRYGGTPLTYMEALYDRNRDLIGWLNIPGVIDLPVVYRDNVYYQTHDFDKNKSEAGTLFLDKNHRFTETTQNLLIHGHNMKDGTMFGRLAQYEQDIDYYRAHPIVQFSTLWEEETYVIFAVLNVPLDVQSDRFINFFSHPTFDSDEAFDAYVRSLQLGSIYAIPIGAKPSDALLTLSTCLGEDRLVIVCRRVREGETASRLRELAKAAVWN